MLPKCRPSAVYSMKIDAFKKVNIHLGYFCQNVCHQEVSKTVQSGHAATTTTMIWRNSTTLAICLRFISFQAIFQLTLAQFVYFWANFHCCKWPNTENTTCSSGHTVRVPNKLCWVYAKLGYFINGKNISVYKNSFPYSADVKPTVNNYRFDFIQFIKAHELEHAIFMCILLSVCEYNDLKVYTAISMCIQ